MATLEMLADDESQVESRRRRESFQMVHETIRKVFEKNKSKY